MYRINASTVAASAFALGLMAAGLLLHGGRWIVGCSLVVGAVAAVAEKLRGRGHDEDEPTPAPPGAHFAGPAPGSRPIALFDGGVRVYECATCGRPIILAGNGLWGHVTMSAS